MYRISKVNYYGSPNLLLEKQPSDLKNNKFSKNQLVRLSNLTGLSFLQLKSMTLDIFIDALPLNRVDKYIYRQAIKYCPTCIKEILHHKNIWYLFPVSICVQHKIKLIEDCSGCRSKITMSDFMFGHCNKCGFYFQKSKEKKINNPFIILSQQRLNELISNPLSIKFSFIDSLNLEMSIILFERSLALIEGVNSFIGEDKLISSFYNKKNGITSEDFGLAIANVYWMYNDFPTNFHITLDAFFAKDIATKKYHRRNFENMLQEYSEFNLINIVYHSYWNDRLKNGEVYRNFLSVNGEKYNFERSDILNKVQLKKQTGLTEYQINNLIHNNILSYEKRYYSGQFHYYFNEDSVKTVIQYVNESENLITKKKTAEILGVNIRMVNEIINKEYLFLKNSFINKGKFLNINEVTIFLLKYRGRFEEVKKIESEYVNLLHVGGLKVVELLEFIDDGYLTPILRKKDGNFTDVIISKSELKRCKKIKQANTDNPLLTLHSAAKYLKRDYRTMKKLIKADLLLPLALENSNGQHTILFNKYQLEEFKNNYTTVAAAHKEYGVSKRQILLWVAHGDLKNHLQPYSRNIILKTTELKRLINKGI